MDDQQPAPAAPGGFPAPPNQPYGTAPQPPAYPPAAYPPQGYAPQGYAPPAGQVGAPAYPAQQGGYGPGGYPPPGYVPPAYAPTGYANPYVAGIPYAGFWIRFAATLIDSIVILLICITIVGIFFVPFYMPLMWWKQGGTVGQKLLGLRVVRAVDGGPITGQMATIRALVKYFLSGLFFDLGYIWAAFEPRKRAWHDMLADTVVIHVQ